MKKITLLLITLFVSCITLQAQWAQIGSDIDGEASADNSGFSASLSSDGSIVAIGAPQNDGNGNSAGHVRIHENINGTWTQIGADIDGEVSGDQSGHSVSLSSDGSIVAIGAILNDGNGNVSGHVRIYENINGTWTQIGVDIDGEASGDKFGNSVSLSSDGLVVAIGAILNDGNGNAAGHVRIYENISGTWTQIGADIDGETTIDYFGRSVSLSSDGTIVAIGAHQNDGNGTDAGHVRIYENINGTWTQIGVDIDGEAAGDRSGYSVSLSSDGLVVAIGAIYNDGNVSNSGHVRIYENINGIWTQIGADIDGEAFDDQSGTSVSINSDGSVVAIGAILNDGNGANAGHVRIFKNINGTWTQIDLDIDGEASNDQFGISVSLNSDGSLVSIGAWGNDGAGVNTGHVRVYENSCLLETTPPNAICQNITIPLDASGNATITAAAVDNGSTDNCGIASMAIDISSFSCNDIGTNNVVLTVTDTNENSSSCTAVVTVEDTLAPTATCQNITIPLDASGNATIIAAAIDNGSTDNCGIASSVIDISSFTCNDIGTNNVVLTVTDIYGNSASCTAVVTVEDTLAPTATCQNITIPLDDSGNATIIAAAINNGSTDNCGIASMAIDISSFNCNDIGPNNVVLTVADTNGNIASCTAVVTVEDSLAPMAICQDITVELDANGLATITENDIDNGSTDNCGIDSLSIDISQFDCSDIGSPVLVTLLVSDTSGNTATCTSNITVVDNLVPIITCPLDQTQTIPEGDTYLVPDYFGIGEAVATDNCTDPVNITSQDPIAGTLLLDGTYIVTITAEDEYGNVASCTFELTVDEILGIGDNTLDSSIVMYPNPVGEQVTITNSSSILLEKAMIYDIKGRLISQIDLRNMQGEKVIDVSSYALGLYLVKIVGEQSNVIKRLIKE